MSDQLFNDYGYVKPASTGSSGGRRKQDCRVPGCHDPIQFGKGRAYCEAHECDYDTCLRLARDRHRCNLHTYCAAPGCPKMRRQTNAAKYCEDHATSIDYELRRMVPRDQQGACLVCQESVVQRANIGDQRALFLCRQHRYLKSVLSMWRHTYNLSDDRITALITDPYCWICKASLKWRFANWGSDKQKGGQVHVDHNHNCCRGEGSCGGCVRGLAHQHCNRRLGHIEAMLKDLGVDRVRELIDELVA